MSRPSEDELIARYFAPIAGAAALGLLDDAARFAPPDGHEIVVTADALVEGVHFFADDPPDAVAKKALRVNLSDLAAKAAEPLGFLLTLALPRAFGEDQLAAFARGLGEDARALNCPLMGGDTVATPGPLTISITALGSVPSGRMIPRASVAPGDRLYVTGSIGDSALGLRLRRLEADDAAHLTPEARRYLLNRYLLPSPRLDLRAGLRLAAHAAMDVSDGLAGDLAKMLRASGVSACVWMSRAPLSAAARAYIRDDPVLLDLALTGGDDYEILAAVPPERAEEFEAAAIEAAVTVSWIGEARPGAAPPVFEDASGRPHLFAQPSFSHF